MRPRGIVHYVYPHDNRISAPHSIGRHVAAILRQKYGFTVHLYNVDQVTRINPSSGSILLGHPWMMPWTCYRRSMYDPRWKRKIMMCPFTAVEEDIAFLRTSLIASDVFLAICGPYWFDRVQSVYDPSVLKKMRRIDLAVSQEEFPRIKKKFSEKGQRRFLYIGNTAPQKNVQYLSKISTLYSGNRIAWMGGGSSYIPGVLKLGYYDTARSDARDLISGYDFLITVGDADANPTTILEAMAWGLIPVCTPQSGYCNIHGIINIPVNDVVQATEILQSLNHTDSRHLEELQDYNWRRICEHYNWDRFTRQVVEEIEAESDGVLEGMRLQYRRQSLYYEAFGRRGALRWQNLWKFIRANVGRMVKKHWVMQK